MLIKTSPLFFRRRPAKARRTNTAPPVPTMSITAASYDGGLPSVSISFDDEINIDAFDPATVIVKSVESGAVWRGSTADTTDPVTLLVALEYVEAYAGTDTLLTVEAGNGIVGADDGAIFPGVTDLVLPFP